jgi:SNF2 family DNA or RNA helicase
VINKATIEQFLARKLASYDWLKACTHPQLDQELAGLSPIPSFSSPPLWLHQKAAFLILLELKRFLFFIDMGGGKTRLTLELIKYRKQRGEEPRAIIFVPYITSVETWVEEVAKHAAGLKCVPLLGTGTQNLAALSQDADVFVICYQSAVAMLSTPVKNKKGKNKWAIKPEGIRKHFSAFDTLVMDEIHRCKTASSLTYRMCRAISAQCEYTLGLTGTPFGRDLGDLWPQFHLIDFGETLGETLGIYRAAFFKEKINYWGGYEYNFQQKMLPKLKQVIKNCSISYSIDEFYDMPPKEYIIRHLPAPPDSKGYVDRAIADLKTGLKAQHYQQVNSSYLQLRQLSSGFMTLRGEDDASVQVRFDQNPKLEALVEILEDVPTLSKVVVFHHFIYTNHLLSEALTKLKIKHARIWGGQRDPIGQLRKFKDDAQCRVLLLNWKSGSSSLNLQGANYLIVFEQPESPIDRKQGEARLWRPGQTQRVLIYDLLVKGTVDARMHKSNELGKDLLQELLTGKETI